MLDRKVSSARGKGHLWQHKLALLAKWGAEITLRMGAAGS